MYCAFIQSLVQSRWPSASSSGFPDNSGLKWYQFRCIICCPSCAGCACCSCCCGDCFAAWAWAWAGGVAVLECLALEVLVLPYLTCSYLTLVGVCFILVYPSYPLLLFYYCFQFILSVCAYVNYIYTVIVEIFSPILKPLSLSLLF